MANNTVGEVIVTKNEIGQIVAVTRQDADGRILEVISESAAGVPPGYEKMRGGLPVSHWRDDALEQAAQITERYHADPWIARDIRAMKSAAIQGDAVTTGVPLVPDGVWEALQRLIENAAILGSASKEDALLVAKWRGQFVPARDGVNTSRSTNAHAAAAFKAFGYDNEFSSLPWSVQQNWHAVAEAVLGVTVCPTCGGTKVDPGGLPICRTCGVPGTHEASALHRVRNVAIGQSSHRRHEDDGMIKIIDAIDAELAAAAAAGVQSSVVRPALVKAYEWSSDYLCRKCGVTFNVSDDSDHSLEPDRGHKCKGV